MKITFDRDLSCFWAWDGGQDTLNELIANNDCANIESMIEDLYPDGLTDTQLNDILWFERDLIANWLGYDSWDEYTSSSDEDEE